MITGNLVEFFSWQLKQSHMGSGWYVILCKGAKWDR